MGIVSIVLFSTTTSLNLRDVTHAFINNFGIVGAAALVMVIVTAWVIRKLPTLGDHLNRVSSFKVGWTWFIFVSIVTPVILCYMFVREVVTRIKSGYEDMPTWFVNTFGWGVGAGLAAIAIIRIPWKGGTDEQADDASGCSGRNRGDPLPPAGAPPRAVDSQALPRMRLRLVPHTGHLALAIRVPLSFTWTSPVASRLVLHFTQ